MNLILLYCDTVIGFGLSINVASALIGYVLLVLGRLKVLEWNYFECNQRHGYVVISCSIVCLDA